jgi:hypothetical protein
MICVYYLNRLYRYNATALGFPWLSACLVCSAVFASSTEDGKLPEFFEFVATTAASRANCSDADRSSPREHFNVLSFYSLHVDYFFRI